MKIFRIKHRTKATPVKEGMVLLFTLIVMITVSSVVGAYLGFVSYATRSTGAQISESQAIYLADAGIHYGIYNLLQDSGWTGTSPVSLGEGTFSVSVTGIGGGDYRLISTGNVYGQSRIVQQDVNSTIIPKTNTWQEQ
ncbi:MAG: hypothetical protein JW837_12115 [Sedimentisphaerales bacterium]|nr:hypothetical protein [Sedimentisphaerales bacterium]